MFGLPARHKTTDIHIEYQKSNCQSTSFLALIGVPYKRFGNRIHIFASSYYGARIKGSGIKSFKTREFYSVGAEKRNDPEWIAGGHGYATGKFINRDREEIVVWHCSVKFKENHIEILIDSEDKIRDYKIIFDKMTEEDVGVRDFRFPNGYMGLVYDDSDDNI